MQSSRGRSWPPQFQFQHPADEDAATVFPDDLARGWNVTITKLMDHGYSSHDATLWSIASGPSRDHAAVAAHADTYRTVGFAAGDAVQWFLSGIHAVDAAGYANHGWTPGQAALLREMLQEADPHHVPNSWDLPYTEPHDAETWWLFTRIPPARTLRYVAAGFGDREGATLERNREAGDNSADAAVDLLVALRRR